MILSPAILIALVAVIIGIYLGIVNSEYKSGSFWLLISLVVLLVVPQLPQSQLAVGGNHTDALIVVLIMVLACVAVVLLRNRRPPPPPPGT